MTISASTFIEDVILFLRDSLRTGITDPLSRSSGWVMTSYPQRKVQYPIITVKQTNIFTQKLGMSSEMQLATITVEVRIWARNAKECDELTSDIIDYLRDFEFAANGTSNEEIHGFVLSSTNSLVETTGDNTVHNKILSFDYKVILS